MKFIGDLHIHSHFSLATSKKLTPEYLDYWGRIKGIKVIGTGDFTHPGWIKELKEKLEAAEAGLFKLKNEYKVKQNGLLPKAPDDDIRFMLTAEISNIYKKGDKTRKIHNVVFAPDFDTVEKIQQSLINIGGNITSDGRPILGLDAHDLLEIVLEASEDCCFVPAHIWTPWFSALGDKSGFNSIKECYRDLEKYIHAVETGLSTDAPMHWMCSFLDEYTLISNSDAHSPQKLGRNANLFETDLSYSAICKAIDSGDPKEFLGTIDLYPQEGKYHYDGHRKCGIRWNPVQTLEHNKICPKCGKPVTIGVMNRVVELSDRTTLEERPNRLPFYSIIPLKEILSEIEDVGVKTKTVARAYKPLIEKIGNESDILLNIPIEEIRKKAGPVLAEAIQRMRDRKVFIKEGFDGQYGEITVFQPGEIDQIRAGQGLFKEQIKEEKINYKSKNLLNFSLKKYRRLEKELNLNSSTTQDKQKPISLNKEQKYAVEFTDNDSLIIAGPGTGKTFTLIHKINYLMNEENIPSRQILALTFTNKVAHEIKDRLNRLNDMKCKSQISTFHTFGLDIISNNLQKFDLDSDFSIIETDDSIFILNKILGIKKKKARKYFQDFSNLKQKIIEEKDLASDTKKIFQQYEQYLQKSNLIDINDLLYKPFLKLKSSNSFLKQYQKEYKWILIDEYQDVNPIQYNLIKLLSGSDGNRVKVCAIGDPNQAIYGFRGADVKYINKFQKDFPASKVINLKTSYRCSDRILRTSGKLMAKNHSTSSLIEGLKKGVKVKIADHETDKSEAEFIARTIEHLLGGVRFFSIDSDITDGSENTGNNTPADFAVLCRTKKQLSVIEKAFNDHGLPYQSVGTDPFFKTKPINKIIDILKYKANPENALIQEKLISNSIINENDLNIITNKIENAAIKETIAQIVTRFYPQYKKRYNHKLKRLYELSQQYDSLDRFIKLIALGSGQDTLLNRTEDVTIMTMHAAKGLEFKYVFIAGCEDKLLPYSLFERQTDIEEERRLLYVGMTRAERYLYLTHVRKRYINGARFYMHPSPFLEEIRDELKEVAKRNFKSNSNSNNQLTIF